MNQRKELMFDAWRCFDEVMIKDDDGVKWEHGKYKFCVTILKADTRNNGTYSLRKHYPNYKKNRIVLKIKVHLNF